jgi:predicted DNA-binding transcriptional regulator AlpA
MLAFPSQENEMTRLEGKDESNLLQRVEAPEGINYCRDHLRRKCKAGGFPQPLAISTARIAWIEAEIDEWLADKARARDQDAASRGGALRASEMAAPDFVGEVVIEPAAQGVVLQANATDTEPIGGSPRGRRLALELQARDTKPIVRRRAV